MFTNNTDDVRAYYMDGMPAQDTRNRMYILILKKNHIIIIIIIIYGQKSKSKTTVSRVSRTAFESYI